jgi:hypothetical protein
MGMWTIGGLAIMIFSGLMLYSSDPDMYYLNWAFLKMTFLAVAVVFNYSIHRKDVVQNASPSRPKISRVCIWICVVFGGIIIGFLNLTLDLNKV